MGRQRRVVFSTSQHKIKGLLNLIHTDVRERSPVASIGGSRYYITFIDDFFKKSLGILLETEIKSIAEV